MRRFSSDLLHSLCVTLLVIALGGAVLADESRLDGLFELLGQEDLPNWQTVEQEIWDEWSKSGSDAMDLLLIRGRDALEANDLEAAIEHLTALTDHAPGFAEGFHQRATAYFLADLYGPSLADLERALALNPRHFGAMIGLATILMELGQEEKALEVLLRADEINPHLEEVKPLIESLASRYGDADI